MLGANAKIQILRPDRDAQGRTAATSTPIGDPISACIQALRLDDEIRSDGKEKTVTLTAAPNADVEERDIFAWAGRQWRVKTVNVAPGLGGHVRAIATSAKQ